MPESFHTRLLRWRFNWFPPYRGSGARITYIDATMREVHVRLPLNRHTRNLNGTIYGGSIYAAVDPIHAVMLAQVLGSADHVVWTKEAHIRFRRQGRTALTARFVLTPEEVEGVRVDLARASKAERWYPVELRDADGHVCATCDILVHIHTRQPRVTAPVPPLAETVPA